MEPNFCVYCMNSISDDLCNHCHRTPGQYTAAPHHLQPGTILGGKYMVGAVLGEGGFGITYIGRDINLDIKVAIKEYFPSGAVNRNSTISSEITALVGDAQVFFEKGKASFLSEARTLAKFSGDSSIVSVRDYFSENNTAYIVMEYLEGMDLRDYLKKYGKLSFSQTVSMLTPIMNALSKIHAQGLIHRDISPANIMILKNGSVKLLDFGAARDVNGTGEKSLSILLKPGFAPEEQYRTKGHQGPWTDVYALSATMYKMMTCTTPVDAMNRIFSDDLQQIPLLNPDITPEQASIIYKGMAVQQADRYQTIDELLAACLSTAVTDQPAHEPQKKKPEKVPAGNGKKKPNFLGFLGSAITGLLAMYFILNATSQILDETSPLLSIILAVASSIFTFLLGRLYYPRINNKSKKPNIICLILGILSTLLTIFCAWITYVNFTDFWAEEGSGEFCAVATVLSLVLPIFFGYFYYPRLERRKKSLAIKIYSGIAAGAVALFIAGVVSVSLNTVTIGDKNIERNATRVSLALDLVTNHDLSKLKELKNLESLDIFECFLDDEDIKVIGELTQLKRLSISTNTDVTDISPLSNLTGLTYLNITNTKVSDISCISNLVNLEELIISNTKISDLSVLKNFTKLDTLKMDSVEGLDASTLSLPASVYTLSCCSNNLSSLDFVADSDSLRNINAANNQISDLTPLSKFKLNIVDLSANSIVDLSPLNIEAISDLDVSTNSITDISCLNGIPAYQLDLGYNQISDISPLADHYKLGSLKLNNNQIVDIGALKDCFKIYSLDISFNQIADISAVETIDELEYFNARGNQISDISPLAACAKFIESGHTVDLRDNQITNLTPLSNYTKTAHMYLSNNKITDISPLSSCVGLEMLKLNDNQITDASALRTLPNLYILEIVDNPVASAEGLGLAGHNNSFMGSATLRLTYHESIDFEALSKAEHLTVTVFNVPPRQQDPLRKMGFFVLDGASHNLDQVDANDDLPKEEDADG